MMRKNFLQTDEGKARLSDAVKITVDAISKPEPKPEPSVEDKQEVANVLGKLFRRLAGDE